MDWTAIIASTALFAGMTYFFHRKCDLAVNASSVASLAKWLRWRHGSFLLLWLLTAVYLYLEPDSSGMVLALWWGLLVLAIVIEAVQFFRTFSPHLMSLRLAKEQTTDEPAARS
jgi:hypothetical protein